MPVLTRRRAGIHAPLAEPLRRVDGGHGQAPLGVTPASERLGHGRASHSGQLPRGMIPAPSPYGGARFAQIPPGPPTANENAPHHPAGGAGFSPRFPPHLPLLIPSPPPGGPPTPPGRDPPP